MSVDLVDLALRIINEVDTEFIEKLDETIITKPFQFSTSFLHQLNLYEKGMDPTLSELFREVEHYRLLPKEIREFLESDPANMFKLAAELKNAVTFYKLFRENTIIIERK